MININKLKGHIPDYVLSKIPNIKEITNDLRLAHFISQVAHESQGFDRVFENLNYSVQGLQNTFGKRFAHDDAVKYAHNQQAIANRAYANRMGNGDEQSGDGWKYAGKGYIQLTGHDNHDLFSKYIGVDCCANPKLVATTYPLESSAWFFTENNIWILCDKGHELQNIVAVTKKINPSKHGLASRVQLFNKFYNILVK
jgi:putative chitinase